MKQRYKHPKEHLIHDECFVEIMPTMDDHGDLDGYNVLVVEDITEDIIVSEWEPDFEWAWETAKYFSQKFELQIVDTTPY